MGTRRRGSPRNAGATVGRGTSAPNCSRDDEAGVTPGALSGVALVTLISLCPVHRPDPDQLGPESRGGVLWFLFCFPQFCFEIQRRRKTQH